MSSASAGFFRLGIAPGAYPERDDDVPSWLDETGESLARRVSRPFRQRGSSSTAVILQTRALAPHLEDLSDLALREKAEETGRALQRHGLQTDVVASAFALTREASRRHLGMAHHDVQLMGGYWMLSGAIAEMATGEGKTLTATLTAATAALAGWPVHIITVNEYLVARDAELMAPVYEALGLRVGAVDSDFDPAKRRAAYAADVTYVTNKDVAFDYLRDRVELGRRRTKMRCQIGELASGNSARSNLMLRGLCFALVDEADSVLIDEARTPLILSAGSDLDPLEAEVYEKAVELARHLQTPDDFVVDERVRGAYLTEAGRVRIEGLAQPLGGVWAGPHRRGELVSQALTALHAFRRDVDYLVIDGEVKIVDESTGRVMADRTWQRGLHQMIEAKEDCEMTGSTEAIAQISYQRFFRRYERLCGMTGTAREVRDELEQVYRAPVVPIPTHHPPKRLDLGRRVLRDADEKWQAIVERVEELMDEGRPVLIGTRSVAASEHLSRLLDARLLPHLVLNARQDEKEAFTVGLAGHVGMITVATNMAGRGTDIHLSDEARQVGGLHVIASENHESARIDRQLYGRCGRQGDPGSCEAIVALSDDLLQAFGIGLLDRWRGLRDRLEGEPSRQSRWLRELAVCIAQRRAERIHASMRRSLLKTDAQVSGLLAFSGKGE
ncbi:MAG: prepilin peptidase [bacterium]|nr:prepilin peptidase [bacterium]